MNKVYDKPLPIPDPDSQPYWDAIRQGVLKIQRCTDCGTYRWPARAMCNRCFSFASEWPTVSGRGVIKSWVTTQRAFLACFEADVPFTTLTVQLNEQDDIRILGQLATPGAKLEIGMPVRAVFRRVTDTDVLLDWEPDTGR